MNDDKVSLLHSVSFKNNHFSFVFNLDGGFRVVYLLRARPFVSAYVLERRMDYIPPDTPEVAEKYDNFFTPHAEAEWYFIKAFAPFNVAVIQFNNIYLRSFNSMFAYIRDHV